MTTGSIDGLAGVLIWTEAPRFAAMAGFYRETLGLTPEVLYRTLAELERSGTIERHTHMIRIIGKGGR